MPDLIQPACTTLAYVSERTPARVALPKAVPHILLQQSRCEICGADDCRRAIPTRESVREGIQVTPDEERPAVRIASPGLFGHEGVEGALRLHSGRAAAEVGGACPRHSVHGDDPDAYACSGHEVGCDGAPRRVTPDFPPVAVV